MRTTFGSFNIATTGLFASQRALDITSHNISNANTEGYSRQILKQRAALPMEGDPTGVVGTGVETYDIMRARNSYLDHKYWGQNKAYNEWNVKQNSLEEIETIFNEPSDTGIRKVMDEFFSSLDELSKKASDNTYRVSMIEKASVLAASINRSGHELANSIRETNFTVKSKVDEINSIAMQITNLNKHIFNYELDGHKANDLRDQRTVLIDRLSAITSISVTDLPGLNGNNQLDIKIGGISLVSHFTLNKLTTIETEKTNLQKNGVSDLGAGKISDIVWEGNNHPAKIEGGELRGLLDLRDGDGAGANYRGMPYYIIKLNEFAKGFAEKFNEQHMAGTDAYGNTGGAFFSVPGSPIAINSINLKVNQAIVDDPNLIAASNSNNGESNNENVKKLINLRKSTSMFASTFGTPDDFVKALLSALSVDSNQAKRMTQNTENLVEQTKIKRMSDSGVSIDEEMANMVKFQQAYSASARTITTLDKIMDTTINRLGLVGR